MARFSNNPKDKYINPKDKYLTKVRVAVIILLRDSEKFQQKIPKISEPQEAKEATTIRETL